jgi:hypothetical protein
MIDEDFLWFINSFEELKRYRGMHIAIWNKQVIGYGRTAAEAYKMAKKNIPESQPALVYIPRDEAMIL